LIIEDYPFSGYMAGGEFYADDTLSSGGRAVVCGGYDCSAGPRDCEPTDACFSWSPEEGWTPFADLRQAKFGHLMGLAPNLDSVSDIETRVPVVIGGGSLQTQIWNVDEERWDAYRSLDDTRWGTTGCTTQYGDRVYHIRGRIVELDLLTWDWKTIGNTEVDDFAIRTPGRCSVAYVGDRPGILIRNGFWFDLIDHKWEQARFPPAFEKSVVPNALYSFRGRATMFGNTECDNEGNCEYTEIVSYDGESDTWISMGNMLKPRTLHEVIEVPKEFCDLPPVQEERKVAMILGGVGGFNDDGTRILLDTVELFGCPGNPEGSYFIDSYPVQVYYPGANYIEPRVLGDGTPEGVLSCGGYSRYPTTGDMSITNDCYFWDPSQDDGWVDLGKGGVGTSRWSHLMVLGPDLESGSFRQVPILIGGAGERTDIYDFQEDEWRRYKNFPDRNWLTTGCFFQDEEYLYHINTEVLRVDLQTWDLVKLGDVPQTLREAISDFTTTVGRCAPTTIDGEFGILLRDGFFFGFDSREWQAKRFPPHIDLVRIPDATWTFRGKPTTFGSPVCDDKGQCEYLEIMAYDAETNSWDSLGFMNEQRNFMDVIEVPEHFCDRYDDDIPPPEADTDEPGPIETVALIVGGWNKPDAEGATVLRSAELFGCPDSPDSSIPLQDYPENVYSSMGNYFEDIDGGAKVLSCGGWFSRGPPEAQDTDPTNACFEWTPDNQWRPFRGNLDLARWGGLMAKIENDDGVVVPVVLGLGTTSEIYNPDTGEFEDYESGPLQGWSSLGCFFQKGDMIYHVRNSVEALDIGTWNVDQLSSEPVPDFLDNPGRCSYLEIDDKPGEVNAMASCCNAHIHLFRHHAPQRLLVQHRGRPMGAKEIPALPGHLGLQAG